MEDNEELRQLAEEKAAAERRYNGLMMMNVPRDPVARVRQDQDVIAAEIRMNRARAAVAAYIKRESEA